MLNVPAEPIVNEALFALVIAGTWWTVRVNRWPAEPLVAVIVSG